MSKYVECINTGSNRKITKGKIYEIIENDILIINDSQEECFYSAEQFEKVIDENQNKDFIDDEVNNPKHYTQGKIETIDFIEDMGFLEGNIIKYVSRYKYKNGLQDLEKAKWYLERLIKNHKGVNNDT